MEDERNSRPPNHPKQEKPPELKNLSQPDLISYINQLRNEIERLINENNELRNFKNEYYLKHKCPDQNAESNQAGLEENHYQQNWSFPTKIVFFLSLKNRPLTSSEIHDLLMKLDDGFKFHRNPKKNLSIHLNVSLKSRRIRFIKQPGIKCYYFVLPEWLEEEGRLRKDYKLKML